MKWISIKRPFLKMKAKDGERGFTLVEVMVSLTIFGIGLLAIGSLQAATIRGNDFAGGTSLGTTWASDKMEKLVSLAYQDYEASDLQDTDGDGSSGLTDATSSDADHQETQDKYNIFWNVADDALLDDTKTICVVVTYDNHGAQKQVSMQCVVPRISG